MRRIQKVLEAASHPNTPPAEALAAITLFRTLIEKDGGVPILFEKATVNNALGGFGLRSLQRRHHAEIEELGRQLAQSRQEAENLRAYAQRGFAAERAVLELETALATARAEVARLRVSEITEEVSRKSPHNPDQALLQEQAARLDALSTTNGQLARDRDEARSLVSDLTEVNRKHREDLQELDDALTKSNSARLSIERERDALLAVKEEMTRERDDAMRRVANLSDVGSDYGRRLQDIDDALAESNFARQAIGRERDALLAAREQLTQERDDARRQVANLAEASRGQDQRLRTMNDALAQSSLARQMVERERDEWIAKLEVARQEANALKAVHDAHLMRRHEIETSVAEKDKALSRALAGADELRAEIARLREREKTSLEQIADLTSELAVNQRARMQAELANRDLMQAGEQTEEKLSGELRDARRYGATMQQERDRLVAANRELEWKFDRLSLTLAAFQKERDDSLRAVTDFQKEELESGADKRKRPGKPLIAAEQSPKSESANARQAGPSAKKAEVSLPVPAVTASPGLAQTTVYLGEADRLSSGQSRWKGPLPLG